MVSGRYSKYNPDFIRIADEYKENFMQHEHAFPSIVGLAYILSVHEDTIRNWCKEFPDFEEVITKIRQKQESVAWFKGMNNVYNPHLCKLLLGKHGYKEQSESDTKLTVTPLGAILDEIQE